MSQDMITFGQRHTHAHTHSHCQTVEHKESEMNLQYKSQWCVAVTVLSLCCCITLPFSYGCLGNIMTPMLREVIHYIYLQQWYIFVLLDQQAKYSGSNVLQMMIRLLFLSRRI